MTSNPCPSPNETLDRGDADERQRRLIHQVHGADARIRLLCEAPAFGAPVFVIDLDNGPQHNRLLGAFRPVAALASGADPELVVVSAMDLIYPARLVVHYEQLMSLAFALCERPATALLLGVGGASMWRFVRAHLPECTATLVDNDESIVAIARRWFYLDQPVVIDTGEQFLAGTTEHFDVILVDLYDARGSAALETDFWARCLDALAPGGCLATNWPDFASNEGVKPRAEAQAAVARARGHDCFFVTRHGLRDNIVQYVPTAEARGPDAVAGALERFAAERHLPDGGRGILEGCTISPEFPVAG